MNGTNPRECLWKKGKETNQGITLSQVTGKGRCLGKVPPHKMHLCNGSVTLDSRRQSADWLITAANAKCVCASIGVTPCVSLKVFNATTDYCIQVSIIPKITYHPSEYMYQYYTTTDQYRVRREPFTAMTIATLLTIGGVGAGTGITSLVNHPREWRALRISVEEDLAEVQRSITSLRESLDSLAEVVLQNRRGLNLLFLQ